MTDPHAHENRGRVRVISTETPEGTVPPSMSLHTPSRDLRGEDVPQAVPAAAAPPDTVALRDRLVEALYQHTLATGVPTPFPPNVPEDPWLAAARRADEARVDALLPVVEAWVGEQATSTPDALRDRLLAALDAEPHLTSRDVADTVHRVYGTALAEQMGRAEQAEGTVQQSREALAAFDGRGVLSAGNANFDVATPREVLDAWRPSITPQEGPRGRRDGQFWKDLREDLVDAEFRKTFLTFSHEIAARDAAADMGRIPAEGEPDDRAAVRHMVTDIIKHLEGRPVAIVTNAVWARVRPALQELEAREHEQRERADAVTHLLEHWADEHMTLQVLGGDEVHADWCYRCRLERADAAEQERAAAHTARVETNARLVELADWASRDLTGQTQHHVLGVITNLRDLVDPDRTLHQPEEDHE